MEVSDMLDVVHFLFDEDLISIPDEDHAKYRTSVRKVLYKNIYNKEYKFGISNSDDFQTTDSDGFVSNGGSKTAVKPYIPPTPFNPDSPNPFQGALREAPLG